MRAFCPFWDEEGAMLTNAQWIRLEPLIEACRPKGKTPPQDLRRTISAILWRHQNGAKWCAIPAELGPWSRAAQTFIRWAHLGVWERRLLLAQERGSWPKSAGLGPRARVLAQERGSWPKSAGLGPRARVLAQERGVQRGMTFLDGTSIRADQKAAGGARKGALQLNGTPGKRWAARVGAMGPR